MLTHHGLTTEGTALEEAFCRALGCALALAGLTGGCPPHEDVDEAAPAT